MNSEGKIYSKEILDSYNYLKTEILIFLEEGKTHFGQKGKYVQDHISWQLEVPIFKGYSHIYNFKNISRENAEVKRPKAVTLFVD